VFYNTQNHPHRAFNYTPPAPIHFPFPPIPPGSFPGSSANSTGKRAIEAMAGESLKRDYEQFINSSETWAQLIFPTVVIWFIITFFGSLIAYAFYFVIMTSFVHRGEEVYKTILKYRFRHIIARVLNAFYFPCIFLSVFAIQVEFGQDPEEVTIGYSKAIIILAIFFFDCNWYRSSCFLHAPHPTTIAYRVVRSGPQNPIRIFLCPIQKEPHQVPNVCVPPKSRHRVRPRGHGTWLQRGQ